MRLKGISAFAFALLAAVPARALESRIELAPGVPGRRIEEAGTAARGWSPRPDVRPASFGDWTTDGATIVDGWRGAKDYVLARDGYAPTPTTDLLLHFDEALPRPSSGDWAVSPGRAYARDGGRALFGQGAASFSGPGSALSLSPGPGAILGPGSVFRDFSVEFWLFPALAENGEVLLAWQSVRRLTAGVLPQQISCVISGGRVSWNFVNLFAKPAPGSGADAATTVGLRARSPLVPRTWSHHLLRFDGDSGLLEYLVDGVPEAVTYATDSGREGGGVWTPLVGAASALRLAEDYAGLVDEFRVERRFVEKPALSPYGRDPALVLSPVADLGYGNSRLLAVDASIRAPGNAQVELSYRISDSWAGWTPDSPAWRPFRPGEPLPPDARGRYVQLRAELFPDGGGRLSPALSALLLRFEADPPPPPPARVTATARDGAVELRWLRVPEADVAGYLVYYGDSPGDYHGTGAVQGPSPVDAGSSLSLVLSGLANGRLLYIAVAAYDAPTDGADGAGNPAARAGQTSAELSARPSRTAR